MEEEFNLERNPLAEAVMVYVAEGKTKDEVKTNLIKLEEEKKKSIEGRIKERMIKHAAKMKVLEDSIFKGIDEDGKTEETKALNEFKEKRAKGLTAIGKIRCK